MNSCAAPSLSRYKDTRIRCRCDGCKAANALYMHSYYRCRLLRRQSLVDADNCRQRLLRARRAGLSFREVAERAGGISTSQVYRIATGQTRRCHPQLERALLAACDD